MEDSADSAVESAIEQYLKPLLPSWSDEELRALVLSHGKDVSVAYEAAASLGPEPDELSASARAAIVQNYKMEQQQQQQQQEAAAGASATSASARARAAARLRGLCRHRKQTPRRWG